MINYLLDRPLKNVYLGGFLDFGAKKETNDVLFVRFYRFENSDNIALKKDVSRLNMKKERNAEL